MRFDDRLATVLRLPTDSQSAKAAVWSQLVVLLAQNAGNPRPDQETDARSAIERLQNDVPLERRKFLAQSLAWRIRDADTLLIFARDNAPVAAKIMTQAQLSEAEWEKVIPHLPPASRALMRERRDLPESITRMLDIFGKGQTALPSSGAVTETLIENEPAIQIRDLVARIEAFKTEREASGIALAHPVSSPEARALSFRFETDRAGLICWVQGAPRGALIGISFAEISEPRAFGVDGHAAGAFRKRSPFRSARLRVAGSGAASGDWLISADPNFDADDGRFCGYRGIARRAERAEQSSAATTAPFGKDMTADSIRQLVHELRSPLNAICGFAEMIDGQLLGPVSHGYREKAQQIVEDSRRLVNIVDDIDLTARLETETGAASGNESSDIIEMVETALNRLDHQITQYDINLRLSTCTAKPLCALDRQSGIRLIERMIATTIGLAETGETLTINVTHNVRQISVAIDRPRRLTLDGAADLTNLSPDQQARCANPPPLGLNFALRLIRQMAEGIGATFKIEPSKFALILPQARDSEKKTIESG